jgi:hypothetical protein
MPNIKKIYSDDPLIKFTTTQLSAERSKQQIDGVLAEYQVKDVYWHYDPPRSIYVMFKIEELINDVPIMVSVRVDCPTIWNRARTKRRPFTPEEINWAVSMRAMYHFIYTHLNNAYAMQSSKTVAFLGYIQTNVEGKVLKDLLIPRLNEYVLEDKTEQRIEERNKTIIDVTPTSVEGEE